jgi:hypothetical protein
MASVRASLMTQARRAAQRLDARTLDPATSGPAVEQLVRCARLSPDAAHTLEWALDTLGAHATNRADTAACQLLRAARARLDTAAPGLAAGDTVTEGSRSLAWR